MPKTLKPPYIEEVDQRGKLHVWIVDGTYIRGHIDEEFTNFGQHYRYPYIPDDEFWIDREAHGDERQFFIDHLLVEHRLMAKGMPYDQALVEADRAERRERRRAGDVQKLTGAARSCPTATKSTSGCGRSSKAACSVWIVNGRLVRSVFDIDFTAGGHDYVYEFVPENEVWIDDDIAGGRARLRAAARAARAQPHGHRLALQQGPRRIEPDRVPLPASPRRTARRPGGGRVGVRSAPPSPT